MVNVVSLLILLLPLSNPLKKRPSHQMIKSSPSRRLIKSETQSVRALNQLWPQRKLQELPHQWFSQNYPKDSIWLLWTLSSNLKKRKILQAKSSMSWSACTPKPQTSTTSRTKETEQNFTEWKWPCCSVSQKCFKSTTSNKPHWRQNNQRTNSQPIPKLILAVAKVCSNQSRRPE